VIEDSMLSKAAVWTALGGGGPGGGFLHLEEPSWIPEAGWVWSNRSNRGAVGNKYDRSSVNPIGKTNQPGAPPSGSREVKKKSAGKRGFVEGVWNPLEVKGGSRLTGEQHAGLTLP